MKITKNFLFILLVLNSAHTFAEESESKAGYSMGIKLKPSYVTSLYSQDQQNFDVMSLVIDEEATALLPRDPSAPITGAECRSSVDPMGPQPVFSLLTDMNKMRLYNDARLSSSPTGCTLADTKYLFRESRFSLSRCENIIKCSAIKISYVNRDKKEKLQNKLNELAAKDFAKNFLKAKIDSMEKLEILKRFAQKNFELNVGKSCEPRFATKESEGIQCQMNTVVDGFVEFQKSCKSIQAGCYNVVANAEKNIPVFLSYHEKFIPKNTNSFQSYFEERTENFASRYSLLDKNYVDKMGDFVSSSSFIAASDEEKENMFIGALREHALKDTFFADPVLTYDFNLNSKDNKTIKDSEQFKNLKALFLAKDISKEDFIAKFNNYRKTRSENLLKDVCSKVPTVENLCKATTSLKRGVRSPVDIDSVSLSNIMNEKTVDKESEDFKTVKSLTGDMWDESDLTAVLDAKRCYAFGYSDAIPSVYRLGNRLTDREDYNFGDTDSGKKGSKPGERDQGAMDDETLKSMGLGKNAIAKEDIVSPKDESLSAEENKSSTQQHYQGEDAFTNNYFNPNPFNNVTSHMQDKDNGKDEVEQKQVESVITKTDSDSSSVSDARIAELVKKLAATEDRLDKLKASTEAADEARVKEKKMAEENALIAELKGQISDLKNKSVNKPAVAQTVADRQEDIRSIPQSSNFSISSRNNSEFRENTSDTPEKRSSTADSGSSSSGQSAPTSQAGRSIASAPQLTSGNSDSGNDQSSGLVLTRVDGMSSEKAIETIANKILELNGVPFLIEEDGITKKVIPLIRNGKIELDENGQPKFVKIKVNRKECTEDEKSKGNCRTPASVALKQNDSVADEKRDQEQRIKREIERAQYLKLKALTNKALTKPEANKKP